MSYEEKLSEYANSQLNVLITGLHGVGKSSIVKNIAENLGLSFKYYSSSTLDPWADIVGIPVPNKEEKTLEFCRPIDIESAEFLFFDELNRAHPRVLNSVLEIIQFKTVNGAPLKNLKMVWAAINPPGGQYQVEDMDPALVDRFHIYFKMEPFIDVKYLSTVMEEKLAKTLRDWWNDDLSNDQKLLITPRRIEYIGRIIEQNLPWKDALPPGGIFPRQDLDRRLRIMCNEDENITINKKNVLANIEHFVNVVKKYPGIAVKILPIVNKMNEKELFACKFLLESLPKEILNTCSKRRFPASKKRLKRFFTEKKVDYKKDFPKIYSTFFKDLQEH